MLLPGLKKQLENDIHVKIILHLKSPVRGDIDNFIKPIIDCIVKRGVIKDDRYIQHLEVIKKKSKVEGFEIILNQHG